MKIPSFSHLAAGCQLYNLEADRPIPSRTWDLLATNRSLPSVLFHLNTETGTNLNPFHGEEGGHIAELQLDDRPGKVTVEFISGDQPNLAIYGETEEMTRKIFHFMPATPFQIGSCGRHSYCIHAVQFESLMPSDIGAVYRAVEQALLNTPASSHDRLPAA
jgi:hypothetical protein